MFTLQLQSRSRLAPALRRGRASWQLVVILGSLVALGLLAASLISRQPAATGSGEGPLVVYCAASNKSVIEAIRADYEKKYRIPLQVEYGSSQSLFARIAVSGSGDLFLPADDSYMTLARERKLLADEFPLATMQAVVAVPKGNPKRIERLDDLMKEGVRLAQASPDGTAIGKVTREKLSASGQWDQLHARTTVYKTTVIEVASDVKVGAVDAGIVFDVVLHDFDTLEAVAIPELADTTAQVGVAVLSGSHQPKQALQLARYLSSSDGGLARYREFGFQTAASDAWSETPELTLYAGSMLRPAIEQTITRFEEREGVRVTRVYNGCGILVAQMNAGEVPDAYFACDSQFMNQVSSLFDRPTPVSQNELVILVKKGNPHGIRSLADLKKEGLRVGIGHEKQCAMGWLTQRTFDESGLRAEVMKNVVVQTPTGDMLVNQMRSGSLDAAVAYLSNAAGSADFLDAVRIHGIPCSVATQPYAVANSSPHKQLATRLLAAIRAEQSRERFTSEGFRWIDERWIDERSPPPKSPEAARP
ncbi:MAG: extracellular solute-binding protein [Planctomycetaceae bacterium]|nr:extracellular solute-binding protein [Planctomycetaceae bacterium]